MQPIGGPNVIPNVENIGARENRADQGVELQQVNLDIQNRSEIIVPQKGWSKQTMLQMFKPITVVLNHRLFEGQLTDYQYPIEAYHDKMKFPDELLKAEDIAKLQCEICLYAAENPNQIHTKTCNCNQKQYRSQAEFDKNDGLINYYFQKAKIDSEMQQQRDNENKYQPKHQRLPPVQKTIQMLVCVTMFNEDSSFLERTLGGIQENLPHFEKAGIDRNQIVVVVLQDGIEKMNENTKERIFQQIDKDLGIYTDDLNQNDKELYEKIYNDEKDLNKTYPLLQNNTIDSEFEYFMDRLRSNTATRRLKHIANGRKEIIKDKRQKQFIEQNQNFPINVPKNVAQLYQVKLDFLKQQNPEKPSEKHPELTVLFCNKHLNGRKLSSHMWFFQGFCALLQPEFIALVDAGTQPDQRGLFEFYQTMKNDRNIGGVSGQMKTYQNAQPIPRVNLQQYQNFRDSDIITPEEFKKQKDIVDSVTQRDNKTWQQLYGPETESLGKNFCNNFCSVSTMDDVVVQEAEDEQDEHKKLAVYQAKYEHKKEPQNDELSVKYKKLDDEWTEYMKEKKDIEDQNKRWFCSLDCFFQAVQRMFQKIHLYFDIKKAQAFEYSIAHILDKNFEAVFGFLNVLPGAWSAYRYSALNHAQDFKENILEQKYLLEVLNPNNTSIKESVELSNMYLAEDRILCLAMFALKDRKYTLKYVPTARAQTDAIDNTIEFALQRRRWINSSWFAQEYVIRNYWEHMKDSKHSSFTKYCLQFQMLMSWLGMYNSYLTVAFTSFVIYSSITQLFFPTFDKYNVHKFFYIIPSFLLLIYVVLVILMTFLSLNYKIQKNNKNYRQYNFVSGIFGVYNFIIYTLVMFNIVTKYIIQIDFLQDKNESKESTDNTKMAVLAMIIVSTGSIVFTILAQIIDGKGGFRTIMEITLSVLSYLYYQPTYSHTLVIYAFCNIDDHSWGTKGSSDSHGSVSFKDKKNQFVKKWLSHNALVSFLLIAVNEYLGGRGYVLIGLAIYGVSQLGIKFLLAMIYHFKFYLSRCFSCYKNLKNQDKIKSKGNEVSSDVNNIFEFMKNLNEEELAQLKKEQQQQIEEVNEDEPFVYQRNPVQQNSQGPQGNGFQNLMNIVEGQ